VLTTTADISVNSSGLVEHYTGLKWLKQGPIACFCVDSKKTSGNMKEGKFLD